jgi:hypothetical protein
MRRFAEYALFIVFWFAIWWYSCTDGGRVVLPCPPVCAVDRKTGKYHAVPLADLPYLERATPPAGDRESN